MKPLYRLPLGVALLSSWSVLLQGTPAHAQDLSVREAPKTKQGEAKTGKPLAAKPSADAQAGDAKASAARDAFVGANTDSFVGAQNEFSLDEALSSDADLGTFVSQEDGPKLDIYGFADFRYTKYFLRKGSPFTAAVPENSSFSVGHLNLYLSSSLGDNWRSLAEVRFTYFPNGNEMPNADGTVTRTSTTVTDYADFYRPVEWGGVILQRAYLEYAAFDFLTIRAGQWLTPYGYWNDDHGSPTVIPAHRPFVVSEEIFPETQTGVEAYGKFYFGNTSLGYFLTLSNGRGPLDTYQDLDGNKAVGARLVLNTPFFGDLEFGVAGYRGRYTDTKKTLTFKNGVISPVLTPVVAYEEMSLGADLRWTSGDFLLQGEIHMNEAVFDDGARPLPRGLNARPAIQADYRRWGTYGLMGYRTPFLEAMPYVLVEYYNFANSDQLTPFTEVAFGVNIRPTPQVVLKAQYGCGDFDGAGSLGLTRDPLKALTLEAAWAF